MTKRKEKADIKTRRRLLDHLKLSGGLGADQLAGLLGISSMGVRQHLYQMEKEGLVAYQDEPRPLGRPAKRWHLTDEAAAFFPDGHQDLALDLISNMKAVFGNKGLQKLLEIRKEQQLSQYRHAMSKARSWAATT